MAELVFFSGTMDCGKSTLALQMDHNHRARDRAGLIYTRLDRAGDSVLSSRLGLETSAREVTDGGLGHPGSLVRAAHQATSGRVVRFPGRYAVCPAIVTARARRWTASSSCPGEST